MTINQSDTLHTWDQAQIERGSTGWQSCVVCMSLMGTERPLGTNTMHREWEEMGGSVAPRSAGTNITTLFD